MQEHAPEDDDDGEVDPFEELGVMGGAATVSGAPVAVDDPLAAFMDDDDEEEEQMLADEQSLFSEHDDSDEEEAEAEPEPEEEPEPEPEAEEMEPVDAYEMLLSTCWIDGILDPAEAKLLARKRLELTISFDTHLKLLREMLERES